MWLHAILAFSCKSLDRKVSWRLERWEMAARTDGYERPFARELFESFCHSFLSCSTHDRSLYFRELDKCGPKYIGASWLDLPIFSQRALKKLSDAQVPGDLKLSRLLYFRPPSRFFKGLDSIFNPGVVVQITSKPARSSGDFRKLCQQLAELLKLWGLPVGKQYMVAYVVPATTFVTFQVYRKRGSIRKQKTDCELHSEGELVCVECCARFFDFKVFGIPLPSALAGEEEKYNLNADERWTLNLNGELERKVSTSLHESVKQYIPQDNTFQCSQAHKSNYPGKSCE